MTKPFHPIAELFPRMPDGEFQEYADDIERNGLLEDIYLYEGKILDGRHRELACEERGIQQRYRTYTGDEPATFALSRNHFRRHESLPERLRTIERLRPLLAEEARRRQAKKLCRGGTSPSVSNDTDGPDAGSTRDRLAEAVGTSPATVARYQKVQRDGAPATKAAVQAGDVSIAKGAEIASLPKKEQSAALKRAKKTGRAPSDPFGRIAKGFDMAVKATDELAGKRAHAREAEDMRAAIRVLRQKAAAWGQGGHEERPEGTDGIGIRLDAGKAKSFAVKALFKQARSLFHKLASTLDEISGLPGGELLRGRLQLVEVGGRRSHKCQHLENSRRGLQFSEPHVAACAYCLHEGGVSKSCGACHGRDWMTLDQWKSTPKDYRLALEKLAE